MLGQTVWQVLVLVNVMSCPGRHSHCSKVLVGLWKEDGREHAAGYQINLMTYLLQRAPWKKKKVSMKLVIIHENFLVVVSRYHWGRMFTQGFSSSMVAIVLSLVGVGSRFCSFLNRIVAITWWNCRKCKAGVSREIVLRETTMTHCLSA